ncbi:hypothetical protein BDC45DRAFT_514103 [Circinella umbellata]|nr:hypothetical protein BDC45DRAFT_514103 [Circinella umbellata]
MVLPPQNRRKHLLLPFIFLWLCWASTSEGFPPLFSLARRQLSSSSSPSTPSSTATINNNGDYNLLQESNKNNATFIHYCLTNQRVPICKDTLQAIHDYIESQSTLDLQVMNSVNFLDNQELDGSIPIDNGFDNEQEESNQLSSFVQANSRLNRRQDKKIVVIDDISYCPCSSVNNSTSSIFTTSTSFSKTVAATGTVETCAAASTVFITSLPPVASTTTRPPATTASNNDCKNTIASTATVTITNAVTLPASTIFPKDCNSITSHPGMTPTSSQMAAPTSQTTGTGRVNNSCDNTMVQSTSTTTVTVTESSAPYGPKTCLITETMKTTLTEVAYGCSVCKS